MINLGTLGLAATLVLVLIPILIALALLTFEITMFIDVIKNKKLTDTEKLLWAAGIIFFNLIASLVYYFTTYSNRKN